MKAEENDMSPSNLAVDTADKPEARSRYSMASREVFSAARALSKVFFIVHSLSEALFTVCINSILGISFCMINHKIACFVQ
ncbi:Uncharacterised protein [Enterobacter hormaechei]|nr:Uncharacterised protein [Enterobacter hormaechei]